MKNCSQFVRAALRFCTATIAFIPVCIGSSGIAGHAHGFEYGFAHPFSGIDHILEWLLSVSSRRISVGGRCAWCP
jgi:hydrogenase/urease accessory protein HupE